MHVHLGSRPSEHTENGKTVLVPQISMETDELHFTTPQTTHLPKTPCARESGTCSHAASAEDNKPCQRKREHFPGFRFLHPELRALLLPADDPPFHSQASVRSRVPAAAYGGAYSLFPAGYHAGPIFRTKPLTGTSCRTSPPSEKIFIVFPTGFDVSRETSFPYSLLFHVKHSLLFPMPAFM